MGGLVSSLPAVPFALMSYRHESGAHVATVRAIAEALRSRGLALAFDMDFSLHGAPAEGWTLWMEHAVQRAVCVVTVWSTGYREAWDMAAPFDAGRGVRWESRHLRTRFYDERDWNRWIAVVLDPAHRASVPDVLRNDYAVHPWPDEQDRVTDRVAHWLRGGPPEPEPEPEPAPPVELWPHACREAFADLIADALDPVDVARFVHGLPDGARIARSLPTGLGVGSLSWKVVELLARHRVPPAAALDRFAAMRSGWSAEVARVRGLCGR